MQATTMVVPCGELVGGLRIVERKEKWSERGEVVVLMEGWVTAREWLWFWFSWREKKRRERRGWELGELIFLLSLSLA